MRHATLFDELKTSAYRCKQALFNTPKCVSDRIPLGSSRRWLGRCPLHTSPPRCLRHSLERSLTLTQLDVDDYDERYAEVQADTPHTAMQIICDFCDSFDWHRFPSNTTRPFIVLSIECLTWLHTANFHDLYVREKLVHWKKRFSSFDLKQRATKTSNH